MPKPIIEVSNLSKLYRLGLIGATSLHESLDRWWCNVRGKEDLCQRIGAKHLMLSPDDPQAGPEPNTIWALKDVSFTVNQGEVLGIIGRNGAGKSTLLKILSKITEPTKGKAIMRGRTSSLLEVGTGFHPELTGRENVYLNGAILGMRKSEISRKFDEIVAFAEIEKFIDTPVKRYSSGMYVRLAFAVAAHLEPEILLVDEVLAVGDSNFQQKCLGKMKDVSAHGRTVLFVSHYMTAITSLCQKCILLDVGNMLRIGQPSDVVVYYSSKTGASLASADFTTVRGGVGDEYAQLIAGSVKNFLDEIISEINISEPLKICMKYKILIHDDIELFPSYHFYRGDGTCAFIVANTDIGRLGPGDYIAECHVPANFLNDGVYFIGLALSSSAHGHTVHFWEKNCLSFNVKDPIEGSPTRKGYGGPVPGTIRPRLNWKVVKEP